MQAARPAGGLRDCSCPAGGKTTGGAGGSQAQDGALGQPAAVGGSKGTGENCTAGGTGGNGKPGTDQAGAAGATTVGALGGDGFKGTVGGEWKERHTRRWWRRRRRHQQPGFRRRRWRLRRLRRRRRPRRWSRRFEHRTDGVRLDCRRHWLLVHDQRRRKRRRRRQGTERAAQ